MRVCILGGGGNVAEAVTSLVASQGHQVSQFRFQNHLPIKGTPRRPPRSKLRLNESRMRLLFDEGLDLPRYRVSWVDVDDFHNLDAFIFAFPSYMAEPVAKVLGPHLAGRVFINLSDRFLGTYAYLRTVINSHGRKALPSIAIAFNGVPIMAQKPNRDSPLSVFFIKSRHSFAWYPNCEEMQSRELLALIFSMSEQMLNPYPSMLHLAFENAHCIEHAVVDLHNLRRGKYDAQGKLYSTHLYPEEAIRRIDAVVTDRDRIAMAILGRHFLSLSDYDLRVFSSAGAPDFGFAGTPEFRIRHRFLSQAPNPEPWGAFGFEDIGWSMVTLESLGSLFGIRHPALSDLIDDWNTFTGCDYRVLGRTVSSLNLHAVLNTSCDVTSYHQLNWLPGVFSEQPTN